MLDRTFKTRLAASVAETWLAEKEGPFGIISAYGDGSENLNRISHDRLLADLRTLGHYRYETFRGHWNGMPEKAVFVTGISEENLVVLGRKYKQEAVVYKGESGKPRMVFLNTRT